MNICPSIIEHTRNHYIPSGWVQRQGLLLQQSGGMSGLSVQPSQLHFSSMVSSMVSSSSAVYKMKRIIRFCLTVVKSSLYILKNGQLVRRGVGERGVSIFISPFFRTKKHFKNHRNMKKNWKQNRHTYENKQKPLYTVSVADPGCVIPDPDFYTSRIPDQKTATKERWKKKFVMPFYVATNFTKLNIILVLKCWR